MHDIGKVAVPDRILQKKGKFTKEEFELMKTHCDSGAKIIKKAQEKLQFKSFLIIAEQLIGSHHEKWDGSGYPQGLSGEDIPLSARVMALADVYDALRSERYYKKNFSHDKTISMISKERGKHFDPDIVDAFFNVSDKFEKISLEYADPELDKPVNINIIKQA